MPIATLQPVQIQANSAGALDSSPDVNVSSLGKLPDFSEFMDAYKQGVITADDIRKRQIVGTSGHEAERAENIARKTQAEQANIDLNDLRPLQREQAKAAAVGATQQQTLLNQLNDPNPEVALPAREAFANRQRQIAAIQVFGTAQPKLEVNAGVEPEPFDDWVSRQVDNFQGTDAQRASYETNLRLKGEKGEEYSTAIKAAKSRTRELTPGTPEYDHELRVRTDQALTHEQLQQIQFKTLEEFGKAQAKASGEVAGGGGTPAASHVVKEFNPATGKEEEKLVRTDPRTGEIVGKTVLGQTAPKLTEVQGKAASFAAQMKQSEGILDGLGQEFDPAAFSTTAQGFVPNRLKSDEVQLYETAKKNWITAVLRQQSGAAIAKHEFTRYESQFFPQDGDSKDVIVQKKKLRDEQTKLMELQAGPAGAVPGSVSPTPSARTAPRPTVEQAAAAPTYQTPAQVPTTVQFFKSPDGKLRVNPSYHP
jgi:hypothetical protein